VFAPSSCVFLPQKFFFTHILATSASFLSHQFAAAADPSQILVAVHWHLKSFAPWPKSFVQSGHSKSFAAHVGTGVVVHTSVMPT
jgi:hypothetical protein